MRWFTRNSPSFIFRKCQLSPDNARSVLKDGCTFHFTGVSHSGHSSSLFRILVPKFSSLFSDKQWNRMMPLVRASESFWGEKLCVLEQVSSRVLLFTFWFNKQSEKLNRSRVSFLNLNIWVFLNWIIWLKQTVSENGGWREEIKFSFFLSAHGCSVDTDSVRPPWDPT